MTHETHTIKIITLIGTDYKRIKSVSLNSKSFKLDKSQCVDVIGYNEFYLAISL